MKKLDFAQKDTICALATGVAPTAIAVIRVSGIDAFLIMEKIFVPKKSQQKMFVATLGDVKYPSGHPLALDTIDEALCTAFPHGKSFTGQASFELSIHGGPYLMKSTLDALIAAGCRLAEPGEFSLRAVLNGKLDLAAAESINDLIASRSHQAASAALRNLKGGLRDILHPIREIIVNTLCEIEARLDFPDEDLGDAKKEEILRDLNVSFDQLSRLEQSAHLGKRLTEGARVVLYGKPNVGKSTLLNALLGEARALVHHEPGTTRDVLEVETVIGSVPIILVDVAGIRNDGDIGEVEQMGIARAKIELERADCVLWLRDVEPVHLICHPGADGDLVGLPIPWVDECAGMTINRDSEVLEVFTKADLQTHIDSSSELRISSKTGYGLENLKQKILNILISNVPMSDEIMLTKARQKQEIVACKKSLYLARNCIRFNEAAEVSSSELRQAGKALDRLLGTSLDHDVIDLIFSRFCIGK